MEKRLKLSNKLHSLFDVDVNNIYFAQETTNNMVYPCIRYDLSDRESDFADDDRYINRSVYDVTYITRKPSDTERIIKKLESIRYTRYVRTYVNDGLYHLIYTITL